MVSYTAAIVLAYGTGMITAYFLVRRFVFDAARQPFSESAPRFVVINVLAVVQTWIVSVALSEHLLPAMGISRFARELGHAAGVVVPAFTSFLGHRSWTFRQGRAGSRVPVQGDASSSSSSSATARASSRAAAGEAGAGDDARASAALSSGRSKT